MAILTETERKSFSGRFAIICVYLMLFLGGISMAYPFMVTITGSLGTHLDYYRRSALPRFLWSRPDRLMRTLTEYFPPDLRNSFDELRGYFPDFPEDWRLWRQVGDETGESDSWAASQLEDVNSQENRDAFRNMAADLAEFTLTWDIDETVLAYHESTVAPFLRQRYGEISELNRAWHIAVDSFNEVRAGEWRSLPLDQQGYMPERDTRYNDLLEFRKAYRDNRFSSFLKRVPDSIGFLRPASLAYTWENFAAPRLKVGNRSALSELPFPVPEGAAEELTALWHEYLRERFPLRHVEIPVNDELQAKYAKLLEERFRQIEYFNKIMKGAGVRDAEPASSWSDVKLTPVIPGDPLNGRVWMDFVRTQVPVDQWSIRDTLPEKSFQKFAIERHGDLAGINKAYGLDLKTVEQLRLPFRGAFLHTFGQLEWSFALRQSLGNYYIALDNLVLRGSAVRNTLFLIILTMLFTLTVNPIAAYAMSRFRLRHANTILLYFVGTMAFPASVSAIPGFLLIRDLGLLNTFAALVLPTAANGMSIFLLKGFFDSLPQELYEAATIDGAGEIQIFYIISLPLVKPILAVNALNAFMLAYNGWSWAILVAQDKSMWTLAVWTYQFSMFFSKEPFVVMAAFLINSLPVFLVFFFCQKMIMRGIILPQMK